MVDQSRDNALDHMVVVLFENRSLDNVLGQLYGPEDGKTFEGVIGKDLSQPDSGVGRARRRSQGRAVHGRHGHGQPEPGLGRGVPAHQHPAVQHPRTKQNRFKLGEDIRRRTTPRQPGRRRRWTASSPTTSARFTGGDGSSTHLRGVRADHDRVHPRAGPRAERAGPRVRGVRPLVLRGAVADVAQPVVLDRGDIVGVRVERAGREVPREQQRRDDLQPARRPRQDVEGLRRRAHSVLRHRLDPLPAAQGSVRDALRAVLAVRGRCRERRSARLLVHRAVPDHGPQRLPPGLRSVPWATAWSCPASTRRRRSSAARSSSHGSTPPTGGCSRPTGSNVWNTTLLIGWDEPGGTYDHVPPPAVPSPDRRPRPASSGSGSTVRATGSRRSSCRRGSPKARCSTRSTATPR